MANNLNNPKQIIQIEGKNKVTEYYETAWFNPTFKSETTLDLIDTDSFVSVLRPTAIPIRKVMIIAPTFDSSIELPYVNKVKITRTEDAPATGSIETIQYVEGTNILNFPEAYGSLITNIEVATTSTAVKQIQSRIYGWED